MKRNFKHFFFIFPLKSIFKDTQKKSQHSSYFKIFCNFQAQFIINQLDISRFRWYIFFMKIYGTTLLLERLLLLSLRLRGAAVSSLS